MHMVYLIGRVALVAIFLVAGLQKLLDIAATAAQIAAKFTIPAVLAPYAANIEELTGMTAPQILAIASAVIEIVFALFIIFNLATRFSALVLVVYTVVVTAYTYDVWNMSGTALADAILQIMKNISIMGGLLMLFAVGPWEVVDYEDDDTPYAPRHMHE
jgi:uncharacterized membrane protein YphA (DoxX/SURF4 family)